MKLLDILVIIVILYILYDMYCSKNGVENNIKNIFDNTYEGFSAVAGLNNCISINNGGICSERIYNGKSLLVMQQDGNLVLYKNNVALWSSNTYGKGVAPYQLKLHNSGDLQIIDKNNSIIWQSGSAGKGIAPYKLQLLDIGAVIIQDSKDEIIWTMNEPKRTIPPPVNEPTISAGAFWIKNPNKDNLCLSSGRNDIVKPGEPPGSKTILKSCADGNMSQQWVYDANNKLIINPFNGLCLDDGAVAKGMTDGKRDMYMASCDVNNVNQKFVYDEAAKRFYSPAKNLCIDDGGGTTNLSTIPYLNHCQENKNEDLQVYRFP